jgi:hypothetical protein
MDPKAEKAHRRRTSARGQLFGSTFGEQPLCFRYLPQHDLGLALHAAPLPQSLALSTFRIVRTVVASSPCSWVRAAVEDTESWRALFAWFVWSTMVEPICFANCALEVCVTVVSLAPPPPPIVKNPRSKPALPPAFHEYVSTVSSNVESECSVWSCELNRSAAS